MRPEFANITTTFLQVVDLHYLNCFLVNGLLNILEGCILVLWLKGFYAVVIDLFL